MPLKENVMRKSLIVGTAGHIDHGKTSLIKHLTGTNTDRLTEEQRRGITIDLGFAHLLTEDALMIGFVDVPGHEKFVKNMLAGAMGMDVVLLIVAADEGLMPQTIEHLHILSHLNIQSSIVVVTKTDLLAPELLADRLEEISFELSETFMKDAAIYPYSIYDEQAKKGLIDLLKSIAGDLPAPSIQQQSRLNIDRVFTMKGHGTVVTGTLIEGTLKAGDAVIHYPSLESIRMKGIQVYGKNVDTAVSGQRVAINLNIDYTKLKRGDVLTSLSQWQPSHILDASIHVNHLELTHWQRVRVYHGTKEVLGRIAIQNEGTLSEGESAPVQLRLESPLYAKINDPIIIRRFSPVITIGGGKIINPQGKKHQWIVHNEHEGTNDFVERSLLQLLEDQKNPFEKHHKTFAMLPFEAEDLENAFDTLLLQMDIVTIGANLYVTSTWLDNVEADMHEAVVAYHNQYPLKWGIERETLRSALNQNLKKNPLNKHEFQSLLSYCIGKEIVEERGKFIKNPQYTIQYTPEEKRIKDLILKRVQENGYKPTEFSSLAEDKKLKKLNEEMVYHLINIEILVKINEDVFMSSEAYTVCKEKLVHYLTENREITVAEYRDMLDLSRKGTLQLLEHFDAIKLTKRNDNIRVLLNQ